VCIQAMRPAPRKKRPGTFTARGLRFKTLEYGGELPDTVPQAIRQTGAHNTGRCLRFLTHGGRFGPLVAPGLYALPDLAQLRCADQI
jgi:hypothetical protein